MEKIMHPELENILKLFSKFLSQLAENDILKTFTFLYCENEWPSSFKQRMIEELKAILTQLCSQINLFEKALLQQPDNATTFTLLSSSSTAANNACITASQSIHFSTAEEQFVLYSSPSPPPPRPSPTPPLCSVRNDILKENLHFLVASNSEAGGGGGGDGGGGGGGGGSNDAQYEKVSNTINSLLDECRPTAGAARGQVSFHQPAKVIGDHSDPYGNQAFLRNTKAVTSSFSYQVQQYSEAAENTLRNLNLDLLKCNDNSDDASSNSSGIRCSNTCHQTSTGGGASFILREENYSNRSSSERIANSFSKIFDHQFCEQDSLLEPSECWNDCVQSVENILQVDSCSPLQLKSSSKNRGSDAATFTANDSVAEENDKYFCCEHCGDIFNTKRKLKIHLKKEHKVYITNINRCDYCGKMFKKKATLNIHTSIHREIKPFKCEYCWKTFTQKVTRDSHVQLHTGAYKFFCDVCAKRFPTKAKLNFHEKCHQEPQWRCEICSKLFTTKQYLNTHRKSHNKSYLSQQHSEHGGETHQHTCIKCNLSFERKHQLLSHMKSSHPDIKFVCYYMGCAQTYSTYKQLKDHTYKKHNSSKLTREQKKKTVGSANASAKFQCTVCRMKFVEKSSFHRHNIMMHNEKFANQSDRNTTTSSLIEEMHNYCNSDFVKNTTESVCSVCGSVFYSEEDLKKHTRVHAADLCTVGCDVMFSAKSSLLIHENMHQQVKKQSLYSSSSSTELKCKSCNAVFEDKMELKQHELDIHRIVPRLEEIKPYSCNFCEKRFTTRGKCNLHMETHSQSRNYGCTKCDKKFFRRDLLKEHTNTHTGYRAYVCKICGLAYSQKSSLKTHESTHEAMEKSISCGRCGKLFHSKQALNFHTKAHDGNYRFACDICGKKFVRKCHYDLHVTSHSTERPFKCCKCSVAYKTSKHLREHTKKLHQNEAADFNSLFDSIYTDEETMSQQQPAPVHVDDYISSRVFFTKN